MIWLIVIGYIAAMFIAGVATEMLDLAEDDQAFVFFAGLFWPILLLIVALYTFGEAFVKVCQWVAQRIEAKNAD